MDDVEIPSDLEERLCRLEVNSHPPRPIVDPETFVKVTLALGRAISVARMLAYAAFMVGWLSLVLTISLVIF